MAPRLDAAVVTAITLVTAGVILGSTVVVLAAAVPFVYVLAGSLWSAPPPSAVTVDRSITPETVVPDGTARVTVTVENETDRTLPDVRVVDRPPERLPVVEGSARGCLSLRSGESGAFSYTVRGRRGEHEFGDPVVRLRSLSAAEQSTARRPVEGATRLHCRHPVAVPPVRAAAQQSVGMGTTTGTGSGVTFHSVRDYRHGDDASRVDWRGFAKTGELSTVTFREPDTTGTVIVVDGRAPGRVTAAPDRPTAAELSSYAAGQLFARATADGHRVGLAALGIRASDVDTTIERDRAGRPWVTLGDDDATQQQVQAVLSAVDAAAQRETTAVDGGRRRGTPVETTPLRERLPGGVDAVVVTPALDDGSLDFVSELSAAGIPVLVVSPDVTAATSASTGRRTVGSRVASIERHLRLDRMTHHCSTVVDWDPEEPLSDALEGEI